MLSKLLTILIGWMNKYYSLSIGIDRRNSIELDEIETKEMNRTVNGSQASVQNLCNSKPKISILRINSFLSN